MKTFFSLLFEKVVYALIFELQMNEIMSNAPEKKKTTPQYDNSFKKSWTSSYPCIKACLPRKSVGLASMPHLGTLHGPGSLPGWTFVQLDFDINVYKCKCCKLRTSIKKRARGP
jgi:hypothetical protein